MTNTELEKLAHDLCEAWQRYVWLFGESPHGTQVQIRAMLELLPKPNDAPASKASVPTLVLPLPIARLIRNVFLPRNPRKMRGAHPDTLAAANYYIDALEVIERNLLAAEARNALAKVPA